MSSDAETPVLALTRASVEAALLSEGFARFGLAELTTPVTIAMYESWLTRGLHGEMAYLERHLPQKRDPQQLMKRARSAIVVTMNYVPHPAPASSWPLSSASTVAAYAKGRDYHHILRERLERVIERLKSIVPEEEFASFTDSSPILERDLAVRAGLGWIGKNTCLLSRDTGSLFFIAEIYTSAIFSFAKLEAYDHCGTCTRCIDACPTGALTAPRELDARKCISYLTIESRELAAEPLREKIGSWLFGCDICQTVCPWNVKVHKDATLEPMPNSAHRMELIEDLRFILGSSHRALERAFAGTALARAGGWGLKRNAIVVAANLGISEVRPEISALAVNEKLSPLVAWAIEKLGTERP